MRAAPACRSGIARLPTGRMMYSWFAPCFATTPPAPGLTRVSSSRSTTGNTLSFCSTVTMTRETFPSGVSTIVSRVLAWPTKPPGCLISMVGPAERPAQNHAMPQKTPATIATTRRNLSRARILPIIARRGCARGSLAPRGSPVARHSRLVNELDDLRRDVQRRADPGKHTGVFVEHELQLFRLGDGVDGRPDLEQERIFQLPLNALELDLRVFDES